MKTGYMCKTNFEHELGEANGGCSVYPTIKDLLKNEPCSINCGIVKVKIELVEVIQKSDFKQK